jgi:hypothetical protein
VDAEHQSAHIKFIEAFIDRYGISERSLEVIVAGLLSYQEDKIYKSLKALMKGSANKALSARAISGYRSTRKRVRRMPCGVKTGGRKFRSSGYLRLVFFLYTSLGTRSASVTYFYIRSLASVVSASSKRKNTAPYLGRFALEFYIQI